MDGEWTVEGVYLLTAGSDGEVAVPQLSLSFLPGGMQLKKPSGEVVWKRSWAQLHELAPVERSALPHGVIGVVIEVVERGRRGRRHRFVIPAPDPVSTEALVMARARAHGVGTLESNPISRLLTAVIAVAAIGTVTILLLSAAHVFRF